MHIKMKKLLFIFNPKAGAGDICKNLGEVVDIFTKAGYEVVAYPTQAPGDGRQKVLEEGAGYDRIVTAGGDGILHEIVNAVLQLPNEVTVGYIPAGTINDFATTHKIPKNNILEAAKIAVSDRIVSIDVGKFNEEYFTYVAAFGIVTNVAYDTDQKAKKRWRILAYVANVIKCITPKKFKAATRRVRVDTGEMVLQGDFVFGAVSNSLSIGSIKNLVDKETVLNDGLLEGLFIQRPKTLKDWDQIRKGLITRDFSAAGMAFVRAKRFEITMENTAWTLDGENGGEHTHIVISAEKQVLKVALP